MVLLGLLVGLLLLYVRRRRNAGPGGGVDL
jgi:LPXTG-motif cell wall-anchored protein